MASVTIAIPAYNAAAFIEQAVESAQAQSFSQIEILVIDNNSDDTTAQRVGRLAQADDRVRLVRNPENVGMTANFNRCLELAAGDYVKFLSADDLLAPRCVEKMLAALRARPEVSLVASARRQIGDRGESLGVARFSARDETVPGRRAIAQCFFGGNSIGEPTAAMFRKDQAARGFAPSYNQAMDLEMWFHLLEKGDLAFIAEPLCAVRRHRQQQTARNLSAGRVAIDKQQLFRDYSRRPYLVGNLPDRLRWDARMAASIAKQGDGGARQPLVPISEVFYPTIFRHALVPLARAIALGNGRLRSLVAAVRRLVLS
jgi:glycosyltransferase involved in cell wall biosynthesis